MKRTVLAIFATILALTTPAHATSFTNDTPTVGVTTTLDASTLCPVQACSYTWSVVWQDAHFAVHTITQLGRTAQVAWTPGAEEAAHGYVVVLVNVGVPQGRRVQNSTYQQSFVVQ